MLTTDLRDIPAMLQATAILRSFAGEAVADEIVGERWANQDLNLGAIVNLA